MWGGLRASHPWCPPHQLCPLPSPPIPPSWATKALLLIMLPARCLHHQLWDHHQLRAPTPPTRCPPPARVSPTTTPRSCSTATSHACLATGQLGRHPAGRQGGSPLGGWARLRHVFTLAWPPAGVCPALQWPALPLPISPLAAHPATVQACLPTCQYGPRCWRQLTARSDQRLCPLPLLCTLRYATLRPLFRTEQEGPECFR